MEANLSMGATNIPQDRQSLCLMHGQLREREVDTLLIEYLIDRLIHIEIDRPIILALHPYAYQDIDATVRQSRKSDKRFIRLLQDPCLFRQDRLEYLFYMIVIGTIIHAEYPIDTAGLLVTIVDNHAAAERTIRDINHLIVGRLQDGMEHLDLTNRTRLSLIVDKITHFIGLKQQDDQAAREMRWSVHQARPRSK